MKRIKRTLLGGWTAIAVTVSLLSTAALAHDRAPLTLQFEKCLDPETGNWPGTVLGGDCGTGTVLYEGLDFDGSTSVWHLAGRYSIQTSDCSFTAVCSGVMNSHIGLIVLNGQVEADSADFAGAQVQVRAELITGPGFLCSAGTLTITLAPAAD